MFTESSFAERAQRVVNYWFVRYNPLFFFSALCILSGVYLVTQGLEETGWRRGQFLLAGAVQAYEILLVAGAALLCRGAPMRRPAVILAIVEMFFLLDCALQTEALAPLGSAGAAAGAVWVLGQSAKLSALLWALRLRASPSALGLAFLIFLGIAAGPHLLGSPSSDRAAIHLGLTWYGAAVAAAAILSKPRITTSEILNEWGRTVLRRANRAACGIAAAGYLLHLGAWLVPFDLAPTPAHAAPFLLLGIVWTRRETVTWALAAAAVAAAFPTPAAVAPTAAAAALLLAWQGGRAGRPRLHIGAVLAAYAAALTAGWSQGPIPQPEAGLALPAALALIALAFFFRMPTAAIAAFLLLTPHGGEYAPRSRLEVGILVLAAGFVALVAGIAVNWEQRGRTPSEKPAPAPGP